jgi:predicted nucleic acid-binding protein
MYLELNHAAYTCPTLFELLAGARDQDIAFIRETLGLCEHVVFHKKLWEKAASIENTLTRKGAKVPRDDIFVATAAADAGIPVFCRDAHFDILRDKAIPSLRVIQAES